MPNQEESNQKKNNFYILTRQQILEGMELCLSNALLLTKEAESITGRKEKAFHALGMYTYAIEEYGKFLLLKKCLSKDGEKLEVPKNIFKGKKSHGLKFDTALYCIELWALSGHREYFIEIRGLLNSCARFLHLLNHACWLLERRNLYRVLAGFPNRSDLS